MQYIFSITIFFIVLMSATFSPKSKVNADIVNKKSKVNTTLKKLDGNAVKHYPDLSIKGASSIVGENLVLNGFSENIKGKTLPKQSKHFVCTSCHNIEKEDPDLSVADPQARLIYTAKKGLPFLQGTTLYGAVNRTSFYNGDYDKKYGDLVKPARNNIREAIQLCAVECAQGRKLKPWELESVLAYLWTLELRLSDLDLSEEELVNISDAINGKVDKAAAAQLVESKFLKASPATFVTPPEDRKAGYPKQGNPKNGALIYENSCLHCHGESRYSYYALDHSKFSVRHLEKHFDRYSRYSVYQVARYGTPPTYGKRAYMPQYTLEKMSNQQLEDLKAYIKERSK